MRTAIVFLSFALLTGCGADAPAPTPPAPPSGGNGPPTGTAAPDPAGGPAANAEVGFGQGEAPSMDEIGQNRFQVNSGTGVKVSGTLSYEGAKKGAILLQVVTLKSDPDRALRENQQADKRYVDLLHNQTLNGTGSFEVLIPRNTGEVALIAFMDERNDGPSSSDAAGMLSLEVGTDAMSGLELALSDTPDLGEYAPPSRR